METVLRIVVIYFFIILGLWVPGKREFAQLSPLELVTLLLTAGKFIVDNMKQEMQYPPIEAPEMVEAAAPGEQK